MNSQSANDEVLNAVDASRRGFLRKIMVGAAFASPIMASFSMDGFFIKEAEANCGFTSNMVANQTQNYMPFCANQTPHSVAGRFKADLIDSSNVVKGKFKAWFDDEDKYMVYIININRGLNFQAACITWASCVLSPNVLCAYPVNTNRQDPYPLLADIEEEGGKISKLDLTEAVGRGSPTDRFYSFMCYMEGEQLGLFVKTYQGVLTGNIVRDLSSRKNDN